jgi:hypothetical protein
MFICGPFIHMCSTKVVKEISKFLGSFHFRNFANFHDYSVNCKSENFAKYCTTLYQNSHKSRLFKTNFEFYTLN